jgi:iron-sulfur cluster repair protein YtfE (RIC family)
MTKAEKTPNLEVIEPIPFRADFTKPLDVLFHCHQKIGANLEALRIASEDLRKSKGENFQKRFGEIDVTLTHFATTGMKHTLDEEESLFPRIREHSGTIVSEVFAVVGQLEIQHKRAASIQESLSKMSLDMATDEELDEKKLDLFSDLSESLYDLYRPHIQMENEFVFPSAAEILSKDELLAIGREMYQRRKPSISSLNSK